MRKTAFLLLAACGLCLNGGAVAVRSSSMSVEIDAANGRVTGLRAANGVEFAAPDGGADLFALGLTRPDDFCVAENVTSAQAARFRHEPLADGVRLVWEDLGGKVARVECTVRAAPGDAKVRFGISFVPTNGWAVVSTEYPRLRLADRIGTTAADDRLLTGAAWGGIHHTPGADKKPRTIEFRTQPGNLTVQAALWWDPHALFYFAAEDDKGDVKSLSVTREKGDGILFRWQRSDYDVRPLRLDYDFTVAAACGTNEDPVTWHDGAELYRDWARRTHFCKVPTAQRKDLPKWMADAPALTLFTREWFDKPDSIRRWVKDCWGRLAPGAPLVAASWGWEHFYTWVHPYFPCHPSDAAFTSLVNDLAAENVYIFPWPSGYHWTLTYGKRADGTFDNDWRADFAREASAHACVNRDGKLWERVPSLGWLKGGSMAAMCGGEEWTHRWWNDEVTRGLATRGCRIVQADQNNGGAFPPCWSRQHPHPPGQGRWKTVAARRQMEGMIAAIRKVHGEGAATYEEPNEQFNDLVGIQLLRDSRPKMEWASLYGYLYHEYVPMFQPYPPRGDLRWMAYSAAEGHMPRFVPTTSDYERNGLAMPTDFLAGPFGADGTNKFHIGKNIQVDDLLFTPGTRFRITATCRTHARKKGAVLHMHYGVYTSELKALARGHMDFPPSEADGPRTLTSEFTMPEGPAKMLRVMLNAGPEARGEVGEMKLEVVKPDGSVEPARVKGSLWHDEYMRRWVALHRGEGRPWLAHGRRIKPPRLTCASVDDGGRAVPAVFVGAYESLDGRRAFVLANATAQEQDVRCAWPKEPEMSFRLAPRELRLVTAAQTVEVRQVFREERFTRGNVNLRPLQAADAADWIWIVDGGPAKGEMDAVRFACDFTYGASGGRALPERSDNGRAVAPRPPQLEIDVSADERFVLFLDGREIARGPHKGLVNHWYYQSYAITGLEPGTHRLEAVVYRMETVRPRAVLTAGKGGFLLKANGAYDAALTTGKGKWRARRITGTRMEGFGDSQGFGGSGQSVSAGTGFLDPTAATGAPCDVKVVRRRVVDSEYGVPREGWALFPTERPDQMSARRLPGSFKAGQPLYRADTNVYYQAADAGFPLVAEMNALLHEGKPVTIPAGTTARLVWDMGDYYCAYPILETSGGAGAEIRWGWAEALYDRAHDRADRGAFDGKRCAHAMRDTFRPDGRAQATFTSPWWRCGRWCEFEVKTANAPLTLTKLACDEVRYPLAARASFACDDASLADVWRLCRRGLENCMHETYMDCPYFEQQMYPGDTRVVMLIANALSGDARLTRFGIGHFDYARRENGLVPMNSPCYLVQDSSTYSMCWVAMLGDYALWNGGRDFLKARLPGMRHTLHLLLNYTNGEGLLENLPGWSFQDWVEGWDFFGNAPDGRLGLSAVNNLLCVYALDSAIRVEEYAGDKLMADYWRARKKALAEAVVSTFWDERRGMVADTAAHDRFSEHAQCLALLSDILPPDRARRALDGLLESTDLARTTVYFSHYLFDVYVKYGHADRFLKRLDLWRGYVKMGLKTPLEAPGVRARSDCHAWGSHPIYHLLTGVAGIKPAANGFTAVRIAPQPGGLKWLKATMPTPKGDIVLDLQFKDNAVSGSVTLPDALPGTFVWQGTERPLHAGLNTFR